MNVKRVLKILAIVFATFLFCFFDYKTSDLSNKNRSFHYSESSKRGLQIGIATPPIHIDNNWSDTKAAGICTGSGLISDPYIIENVIINGGGVKNCIVIENSSDYFIIRNCSLYNSNEYRENAGIKLLNTDNGLLINNDCFNNYIAIFLFKGCNNNNISNNSIYDNQYLGIQIYEEVVESNNNIIFNNTISNNGIYLNSYWDFEGIHNDIINNTIIDSKNNGILCKGGNNTISGNTIINCKYTGIGLGGAECEYNLVINNTIINCERGIVFSGTHITLINNRMENCGLYTLELSNNPGTYYNIDNTNTINNRPIYFYEDKVNLESTNFTNAAQIFLLNCSNVVIKGLYFNQVNLGMLLSYCNSCSISEITSSNNYYYGIRLTHSNNCVISKSSFFNNTHGISFHYGNQNHIINNNISFNLYDGMQIHRNNEMEIHGNIISNNGRHGIDFSALKESLILNNTIKYNSEIGIRLSHNSDDNIISNNTINYNDIGISLSWSNNNTIMNNLLKGNNECIIENQANNYISDNECILDDTPEEDNNGDDDEDDGDIQDSKDSISFTNYSLIFIVISIVIIVIRKRKI